MPALRFYYLDLLTLKCIQWSNFKGLNKISNIKNWFYFIDDDWWAFINKIILVQSWYRIFHPQSSKDFIKGVSIIISILYMRILRYRKIQWHAQCHTTVHNYKENKLSWLLFQCPAQQTTDNFVRFSVICMERWVTTAYFSSPWH